MTDRETTGTDLSDDDLAGLIKRIDRDATILGPTDLGLSLPSVSK